MYVKISLHNHRKCQKAHSGIGSSRQGLGQARTLARRLYKELHHTTTVQGAVLQILSLPCSFLITGLHPGSVRPDVR